MIENIISSYAQSDVLSEFLPAFLESQKNMEPLEKNKRNDFHHNQYADLAQVLSVVRPVLNENGIVIMFFPCYGNEKIGVETRLIHISGQWISNTVSGPLPKYDPQGVGIALTYFRRYGLTSLTALAQEDKDGNLDDKPNQPKQSNYNKNYKNKNSNETHKNTVSIDIILKPLLDDLNKIKEPNQFIWYMKSELPRKKLNDEAKKALFPTCIDHGKKLGVFYIQSDKSWIKKEDAEGMAEGLNAATH